MTTEQQAVEGRRRQTISCLSGSQCADLVSVVSSTVGGVIAAAAVGGGAGCGHATQLVLAGELAAELGELGDEVLADLCHGVLGRDGAVGLDADEELGHVRVSDWWVGEGGVSGSLAVEER